MDERTRQAMELFGHEDSVEWARRRSPEVWARIVRLNPNFEPCHYLNGWHPKLKSWRKAKKLAKDGGAFLSPFRIPGGRGRSGTWDYPFRAPATPQKLRERGWIK